MNKTQTPVLKHQPKPKVCVALSGGVDSSVAIALLQRDGYEVVGAFMKNWSLAPAGVDYQPWEDEARDAQLVCQKLGVPFYLFDFEEAYQSRVVEAFVQEYAKGRTPNPDVLCNKEVKFDLFLAKARELGATKIATGHYAQIVLENGAYRLLVGTDSAKDQSYFLYTLSQKELAVTLFPIGHLHKTAVRELARQFGLSTATKKDSQGICFIGPVSMRRFLQNYLSAKPGNVVDEQGKILGQHDGVMFYTEGQRHGFDTGGSHMPLYVAEKHVSENELVVVPLCHPKLYARRILLESMHWVGEQLPLPLNVSFRVRYQQVLQDGTLTREDGHWTLNSVLPVKSPSRGQSLVLYRDKEVLGGGIIAGT